MKGWHFINVKSITNSTFHRKQKFHLMWKRRSWSISLFSCKPLQKGCVSNPRLISVKVKIENKQTQDTFFINLVRKSCRKRKLVNERSMRSKKLVKKKFEPKVIKDQLLSFHAIQTWIVINVKENRKIVHSVTFVNQFKGKYYKFSNINRFWTNFMSKL